ncbi:hypothetical protein Mesau_02948 [Mesorhizobium australicum WSM2073]|uniref:Uncharacterized protein n=1 Tax=Mesorhizobium australicum (strain HAMBI 3006 / LMG 24608 / WSM2073) TaxID=754035 RepID=L0KMX1_MESAW|nr:hypothetical protein Mesau_02948 [Mesorhizobium australicum WSM2073]
MRPCVNKHLLIIRWRGVRNDQNLGNGRYVPPKDTSVSLFGKVAPALFPLVAAALGYVIGRQFLGL